MILRWKARGIEIRGEAAALDTDGKDVMPTFADAIFRSRLRRIISRCSDDPHRITPTNRSIPSLLLIAPLSPAAVRVVPRAQLSVPAGCHPHTLRQGMHASSLGSGRCIHADLTRGEPADGAGTAHNPLPTLTRDPTLQVHHRDQHFALCAPAPHRTSSFAVPYSPCWARKLTYRQP
jgi:hypothetical protein